MRFLKGETQTYGDLVEKSKKRIWGVGRVFGVILSLRVSEKSDTPKKKKKKKKKAQLLGGVTRKSEGWGQTNQERSTQKQTADPRTKKFW